MNEATTFGLSEAELAVRRGTLGASEIGAVLGVNPWSSAHDVWMAKVLGVEKERSEAMDLGNEIEPAILGVYARRYGKRVTRGRYMLGPEPWMSATPDAHIEGGGLVEAKLAGLRTLWMYGAPDTDESESDAAPMHYVTQALWQMAVTGEPFVHIAVLMGTEFRRYTIRPNPRVQAAMVERGRQFWHDHVVPGVPPPVDASEGAREMLKRLYPKSHGPRLEADASLEQLVAELVDARRAVAEATATKQLAENRIKEALGAAPGAYGDGWTIRYATTKTGSRPFVLTHLGEKESAH
jgi:putative phage-type endonuclease